MKIKLNYQNSVLSLPGSALEAAKRADAKTLRALLLLADCKGTDPYERVGEIGLTKAGLDTAVAFWQGAGIIEVDDESGNDTPAEEPADTGTTQEVTVPHTKIIHSEYPEYSSQELASIVSGREDVSQLIDECQKIYGKTFSTHEIGMVISLLDYLSLDMEYVLSLVTYCASLKPKSVRNVQKLAFQFYDEGITEAPALHERLRRIELLGTVEGKIRTMFGIGARSLTAKELAMISRWTEDYHYDMEQIQLAYEQTVNASGTASLPYADAILKRWHEEGYNTTEQIRNQLEKPAERPKEYPQKSGKKPYRGGQASDSASSFDIDAFLDAAIERTEKTDESKK